VLVLRHGHHSATGSAGLRMASHGHTRLRFKTQPG
jgi:hypothetical protein